MPSLTDGEIRRALKQAGQTGKQLSLIDGDGHGTGRLVLVMKPMPTRVTADWMAQQWRDQKRLKKKLGSYPSMSLSKAREVFSRDFADMIQKGRSIKIAGDTRPSTVADPSVNGNKPHNPRISVVLPEPLGPSNPKRPNGMSSVTSFKACTPLA